MVRISIDIGGTFTDLVAETAERMASAKVLTSSEAPEVAALEGMARLLEELSLTPADVTGIVHGTTLATNALIERRGARTALVTTKGFRDVLEMRHEKRFDQYALDIRMPEPLVPRPLRFGVTERVTAEGAVLAAPDPAELDALCDQLQAEGVEAVAIGFLHAYKRPDHERQVAEHLRARLGPEVTLCLSAEVAGEIREYERFSTVCANAYVRPLMARYLGRMLDALSVQGFNGSFLMMLSDGSLTSVDQAMRFPIRLVEGGPAGGVALAAHVARQIGSQKTLSLDIGGTTAKICFIEGGTPKTSRRFEIARAWRDTKGSGLPVRVPTVELVEIGAGGGSIARIDTLGRLKAGPQSAGSTPGPAAYDRGGDAATITDAHIVTGNIDPEGFAGGVITLRPERAKAALTRDIQAPLELPAPEPAAAGVIELADETMANAARVHGVELGLDVASFDLLVSGGGGGLHGARIADKLGIRRIIVPQDAGVGSAVGFLRSPVAFERALSVVTLLEDADLSALADRVTEILTEVRGIVGEVAGPEGLEARVTAELRYQGQGLEVALDLPLDGAERPDFDGLEARFLQRYAEVAGFTLREIPVELVSISVAVREPDRAAPAPLGRPEPKPRRNAPREVFDLAAKGPISYDVVARPALNGCTLKGPVVVVEPQTTTLVRPGWTVRRADQGHLVMERGAP
ncbi:hydantoinase/oxoprolinase family protein [Roseivivax sp. GX 12232]|uniref:hydantoinase/oxoprolinase family protein n=1 Tax=Roseivivax sp. GX 12232 TaxID=2900547 RepID=UPI001E3C29DB|nr:hydantoinase/oxoprolinase family protein [Roseivivax sp. GX 12232]MCE0504049.1 hydantoinase/oxoprolinase family protein [Roseivivax sp. GX 12232]